MPFSDAAIVLGANAIRSALGAAQLHTGNPGAGGAASKSSAAPLVPAWTVVDANGNFDLAVPLAFTGATPNGPIKYVSLWSTVGGSPVWYGNFQLSGDQTADSAGNYTVNSLAVTRTA
ncbi:hypothetical protein A5784_35190 [Mycobacterium sp. 852013-50091_SCH5140682]|uniref:hypothetical protein n=1 Tax=Mycobacterium sp. 852013-50091_SCH5140682 TaxID=1834109 RepID=UPI0007E92995|nr:hypothetical protein [Mycobacterium sp. 852013-50091_SCH5140682]OBC11444.1 hypothetical protein A5784_35190 [Mycobacterium sp. 852013-50091_SCH5140682]